MADFFHAEAEEASSSEESELGSDGEPRVKKKSKKKKKAKIVDSSEEDDEDEEMDEKMAGFIDDNADEESEGSGEEGSGPEGEKRKHEESELEEDLDEDDYDLLDENLGIKVKRKKKRKRIQVMSEDEESGGEGEKDDKDKVANQIFDEDEEGGGGDSYEDSPEKAKEPEPAQEYDEGSGEESEDDFIVDDDGQPIQTHKKKKHIIHDDQALQEAQDIFGVDFDFDEFDQYGDEYDEAEEEDEEEEYEDDEEEEAEKRVKAAAKKKKKKGKKTTIFEMFEPSELETYHFTEQDQEIRTADMPERFQLRGIPVCPTEEGEMDDEADWIYKHAFQEPPVSSQEYWESADGGSSTSRYGNRKGPNTVGKIKSALNFMRNQLFEVPFIAFYRKEYVEPELNINDLWKVYQWDEKWMQLRKRKANMVRLFEKMQTYQFESIDPDKPLESHVRALTEEDLERVRNVSSVQELNDVYQHFLLYYGNDMVKMKSFFKVKLKKEKEKEKELNADPEDGEEKKEEEDEDDDQDTLKQASRKSGYSMCVQAGLAELARKFGLSPEKFGENLRDNYQRHDVEQDPAEPLELAQEFIKGAFGTAEEAMKGAGHMVAMQIAHEPIVRQVIRQVFYERAMFSCAATKKGINEINEDHPCYAFKYIKNKPLKDIKDEQFLQLTQAVEEGCMTYDIHMDEKDSSHAHITYYEEIRQLYHRDEFSNLVQEWNNQRSAALERALTMIVYPLMVREAKARLMEEAKEHIVRKCCYRLYGWLKVAPYQADQQLDEEEEEMDSSKGLRVMGLSYSDDRELASYGALIDGDGEVADIVRMPNFRWPKHIEQYKRKKQADMDKLKEFISDKKPHVIGVIGFDGDAKFVIEDIKAIISELEQEQQMNPIQVELIDCELSILYGNSKKSEMDFREYPVILRQAISIARRLQDPLVEFAEMCNTEEDILCLKYHPMQDCLNKDALLSALYLEFVNRVNEVGVDINRCVSHAHTAPLVQFVCGLGPRKGNNLHKILKQNNSRLENRTQLVVMCHMGPKVFINCAGFIKIDTSALGDSTEAYVEVLDGSRVHPETYEWARKMAVDALEYDDTAEDANPAGALEEILENPERLKDLDLDAFADELERQGYGNKHITLYDIRAELNHRYKDLRSPFRSPTLEERFNMLSKETPQSFYNGKMVLCRVTRIEHKRPQGEQLDQANPVRDDETGLWQCPFCRKNDFPELSEVWNHFDAGECVGQAVGIKVRLDNGITGFIHIKNLSDSKVTNPEERVKIRMPIHARIIKIDIDRFAVELTSKTSDLLDKQGKFKPAKDAYYDDGAEEKEKKKEEDKKKKEARQTYVKRVIVHPQFKNIDYKTCVREMEGLDPGDVIIRPSSKGTDHLTCTWKVNDDIYQHLDIKEDGKENAFSLGRSLWIGNEEFEDLDEIIARFVQPMSQFARDIINHKYYRDTEGGKRDIVEKVLFEEKKKAPSKIPYYFSASKQFPGKFMLSYLPRKTPRHEFATVTPEGVRYRGQMFHSINASIRWFKEHFKDPIPGSTPQITPRGGSSAGQTPQGHTPGGMRGLDTATLHRAAAGLPSNVFNTLAQVAGQQTPMMGRQNLQTPMMTPMMTPTGHPLRTPTQHPYVTPGGGAFATPQYQPTPRGGGGWPAVTPGRTPQVMPGSTPVHGGRTPQVLGSGGRTPQLGGRTPQATPGKTPQLTPNRPGPIPHQTTPSGGGRPSPRAANPSSQDWAKMAQMWAKRKDTISAGGGGGTPGGSGRKRTPRGQSPYGGSTPGTPRGGTPRGGTPRDGDSTPLFDER